MCGCECVAVHVCVGQVGSTTTASAMPLVHNLSGSRTLWSCVVVPALLRLPSVTKVGLIVYVQYRNLVLNLVLLQPCFEPRFVAKCWKKVLISCRFRG